MTTFALIVIVYSISFGLATMIACGAHQRSIRRRFSDERLAQIARRVQQKGWDQ